MAKPLWRQGFDTAERAVAPHLEAAVQSDGFVSAVVLVQQGSRGVRRRLDAVSRTAWHLLNLPAGTDVRRLRRQVASLDHEVRLLRRALEERLDDEGEGRNRGNDDDGAARTGGRGRAAAPRRGAQRAAGQERHPAGDGGRPAP
jgi:hypothetical protein